MYISKDILYIGVNDHNIDLFEGHYSVPNGMAYNSYAIIDDEIAIMDTVDARFSHEWLDNIDKALGGRKPDYLVVQHMEPDHSANIENFIKVYPNTTIVANEKSFIMMANFFGKELTDKKIVVANNDRLPLGHHTLHFVFAPMVHWPEVMVSYDDLDEVLFSADGFGKFGALDREEPWEDEARRYYIGIVGKYGAQVQALLKVASGLEIKKICPLHGPVLDKNLGHYISLYDTWSSYAIEEEGICVCYTSVYGNTKKAVNLLVDKIKDLGCTKIALYDLARCDMSKACSDAFRFSNLVLATTTYNADIFPYMREFVANLVERNFQNRKVAIIENGSWAPLAKKVIKEQFANLKNITYAENCITIKSGVSSENKEQIEKLANELCRTLIAQSQDKANKSDMTALFRIGYGLYVVTSNDGKKDNGLIVNTVTQVSDSPNRVAVNINKANYSYHIIKQTGVLNVNCLSVEAPFSVFESFGFVSGRTVDKFKDCNPIRLENGLVMLPKYINACISLKVEDFVDLGSHGMFICSVTGARVVSDKETMTYTYYQKNVKPKPKTEGKKGWVCKVCGYVYEGEKLPDDFVCPLCKHGASDFEPIK